MDPLTPRRGWIAVLLSVLLPGLGHVYSGRGLRGVFIALGQPIAGAILLLLSFEAPTAGLRLLCILGLLVLVVAVWIDAARVARKSTGASTRIYQRWYVYTVLALVAVFGVQPVVFGAARDNIGSAWTNVSGAMSPTLLPGDYMLSQPLRGRRVERGIIAVISTDTGFAYIQRVVGLPGDILEMRAGQLFVNGAAVEEPYASYAESLSAAEEDAFAWQNEYVVGPRKEGYRPTRNDWGPIAVPEHHYFTLGDNRDASLDSRYTGFVPSHWITHRARWLYLSRGSESGMRWSRIGAALE